MGYNITIGELETEYYPEDSYIFLTATSATHDDAPDHCPFTKNGNSRSPSYTAWSDFCDKAGISELFYGQGWSRDYRQYLDCSEDFHREIPLLRDHPGARPITKKDADYVTAKLKEYQQKHPNAEPGFWDDPTEETNWQYVDNGKDSVLARLMWLEFWMRWAIDNCKQPVVANS